MMRKYILGFSFLLFLSYTFTYQTANSHTNQPDTGSTKDPVNNQSCSRSGCHSTYGYFTASRAMVTIGTTTGNQVALNGFQYSPGTAYIVNFTVTGNSTKPGFSMSALTAANANAGTFAVINTANTSLQTLGTIKYIGHKSANTNNTWSFNWTAPATNVGNITFYSAVNKSNASGSSSGDSIFHQQYVITAAALSVSAGNDVTVCSGNQAQLQATSTGSANATYAWGPASGLSCTNCANPVATPGGNTTYTVTVTDNGQTATDAVNVNIYNTTVPTISSTANAVCPGGTVTLSSGGFSLYSWSNGATTASTPVTAGGTYNLTATDANGCTTTATKAITQGTTPVPAITTTATYICGSTPVTLNAGSFSSYLWSNNATTQTTPVNQAGTYTVTVTNSTGCTGTASVILQQYALPVATVSASGPLTFCSGQAVTLTAGSGPGYTYKWSTGVTAASINVLQSGSYRVTVYNPCDSAVSSVQSVTVNPVPVAQLSPVGPVLLCNGASQVLTASPSGAAYAWYNNGNVIQGQSGQSLSVSSGGSYSVAVTATVCADTSDVVSVSTAGSGNTIVDIMASQQFVCAGTPVTLNAGAGYTSYSWLPGNSTAQTLDITSAGTYIVQVVVSNGNCNSTGADTITVPAGPDITAAQLLYDSTVCAGDTVMLQTQQEYTTYLWADGAVTPTVIGTTGQYSVTVSQAGYCGTSTAAINATGTPLPDAGFSVAGAVLTANATGIQYQWYLNGEAINGATSSVYTAGQSGSYSLQVTHNGCSNISAATQVVISNVDNIADVVLNVYPNPAKDVLVIKAGNINSSSCTAVISSADGRISRELNLIVVNGEMNAAVDVSLLPQGIYILRLHSTTFVATLRFARQ